MDFELAAIENIAVNVISTVLLEYFSLLTDLSSEIISSNEVRKTIN